MGSRGPDIERLSLPEDASGFVRRACPVCSRPFKVRAGGAEEPILQAVFVHALAHANAEELSALPNRFCPYCGHQASAERFLTPAQRAYIEARAGAIAGQVRYEQLMEVERHLDDNPYLTFIAVPPAGAVSALPPEPDDLTAKPLLCCGGEIKLEPAWGQPFFCPHCRARHDLGLRPSRDQERRPSRS